MKTFVKFLHESQIMSENNLFSYTSAETNEDGSTTYRNVVTKFPIGSEEFSTFIPANSVLYTLTVYPSGSAAIVTNPAYPEIIVSASQMAKSALMYDRSVYQNWETQTVELINKLKTLCHDDIQSLQDMTGADAKAKILHKVLFDTVLTGEI